MNEIKSRADLLEAAAKMMRMCDEAGIEWIHKFKGIICHGELFHIGEVSFYEFPLAVVEGNPVFKGDKLYDSYGRLVNVEEAKKFDGDDAVSLRTDGRWYRLDSYSWNPPKPRTVRVELLREDAEIYAYNKSISLSELDALSARIQEACIKALENEK